MAEASSSLAHVGGTVRPFFETSSNPDATRRLLLVFFYFAPSAEVGALRWLALTRFAAERRWAVDVVCMLPEYMGTLDPERLKRLPPGVRLFGFSGEDPAWYRAAVAAWRRVAGRNHEPQMPHSGMGGHLDGSDLMVPLSNSGAPTWRRSFRSYLHFSLADLLAGRAASVGLDLALTNRYEMVISSGPPHAGHESARRIAERTGLPFVMDMRDPWSDESVMPDELRSVTWRRAATAREQRCLSAARLVVVTSKAHEEQQLKRFPWLGGRVKTVMNGADPDPLPPPRQRTRFTIAFAGSIYLGRNPRPLFRAAARVVRDTDASPDEFLVEFLGDEMCEGVPLTTIAAQEGLSTHFRSHGFRPRREALEFLAGASVLVSLAAQTPVALPAKLFEYTRFEAWILALAEPGSATTLLLDGTGADTVAPDDVDGIARAIANRFQAFRQGERPRAINADGRFDRGVQAGILFDTLDTVSQNAVTKR